MAKRTQFVPWKTAGNKTESGLTADDVVRTTGWVFNNETGTALTLGDFVATGEKEVRRYMRQFELPLEQLATQTLLEIGSGIGRMTAAFTNLCAPVSYTHLTLPPNTVGQNACARCMWQMVGR